MYEDIFYSVSKRLSWAAGSVTTALTDLAADLLASLSPAQQNPRSEAEILQ